MTTRRKVDIWSSEGADAITRMVLSLVLVAIIGYALDLLFFNDVPKANHDVLILILGSLLNELSKVYAFSFNSTASAARKDKLLANSPPAASTDSLVIPTRSSATVDANESGTEIKPET